MSYENKNNNYGSYYGGAARGGGSEPQPQAVPQGSYYNAYPPATTTTNTITTSSQAAANAYVSPAASSQPPQAYQQAYIPPPQEQQQQQQQQQYAPPAPAVSQAYNAPMYAATGPYPTQPTPVMQQQQQQQTYGMQQMSYAGMPNEQQQQLQQQQAAAVAVPEALNAIDDNGLRWVWSTYPTTARPKTREHVSVASIPLPEMVMPLACMYTPLKPIEPQQLVLGDPDAQGQCCAQCGAYWNLHCHYEEDKFWVCRACLHHNRILGQGSGLMNSHHPALQYETVEYIVPNMSSQQLPGSVRVAGAAVLGGGGGNSSSNNNNSAMQRLGLPKPSFSGAIDTAASASAEAMGSLANDNGPKPVFIFVVDTCLPSDELEAVKNNLLRCLSWLPGQALVGLISFGSAASVWEVGTGAMFTCHVLRGERDANASAAAGATNGTEGSNAEDDAGAAAAAVGNAMAHMLHISAARPVKGRFLAPLAQCEFTITSLLEQLQNDTPPLPPGTRAMRATGPAVEAAVLLLERLQFDYFGSSNTAKDKTAASASANNASRVMKYGKVMLFTGGPCTRGAAAVVSLDKAQMMRSHHDIIDGDTPLYDSAFDFYNRLERRLIRVHACLDVFAQSFDQVGVMEMRHCVNHTGGTFICGDAFAHESFALSLERYFDRSGLRRLNTNSSGGGGGTGNNEAAGGGGGDAGGEASAEDAKPSSMTAVLAGFAVAMRVHTSADTLVHGVLGPCVSDTSIPGGGAGGGGSSTSREAAKKAGGANVPQGFSPVVIGEGGTTRWRVSALDQGITYAYLFDTATLEPTSTAEPMNAFQPTKSTLMTGAPAGAYGTARGQGRRFFQFVTRYVTSGGERRVRVTSVEQPVAPGNAPGAYYVQHKAFDATCASTVVARMAVSVLERLPNRWDDAKRWLDTLLVRFVRRYGTFTPGQPESLRLEPCCALFPSFMFNLRRSEYFMLLNISPDETTYKRHWLMREPVDHCVLMIQPTLDSYDYDNPYATAVPLDSGSLREDNIVLMDAFFNMHIMWGPVIYEWIKAGYQDMPEHAYFAELLENVEADAQAILALRYPYPRFSRTDANGSEARHVKTRVNPTTTYKTLAAGPGAAGYAGGQAGAAMQADLIYTDDASCASFMQSLQRAVVMQETSKSGGGTGGISFAR